MRSLQYHEEKQRGSKEFPLDYHYIDRAHARYEMPYHWHEETEILFVRSGGFSLSLDGESMELSSERQRFSRREAFTPERRTTACTSASCSTCACC